MTPSPREELSAARARRHDRAGRPALHQGKPGSYAGLALFLPHGSLRLMRHAPEWAPDAGMQHPDPAHRRPRISPSARCRISTSSATWFPISRPMFDKHRCDKALYPARDEAELNEPRREFYQSPEELEAYLQFTYCIKCGCCMGACPTLATDARYLGPMPLTAAQRYNIDTRDDRRPRTQPGHGGIGTALSAATMPASVRGRVPRAWIRPRPSSISSASWCSIICTWPAIARRARSSRARARVSRSRTCRLRRSAPCNSNRALAVQRQTVALSKTCLRVASSLMVIRRTNQPQCRCTSLRC